MLTEAKFNAINALLRSGCSDENIMDALGVNERTLDRVKRSNGDYNEYRRMQGELVKSIRNNGKKQHAAQEQPVAFQVPHYMMDELRKTNELLTHISNKLAFIVESLQ